MKTLNKRGEGYITACAVMVVICLLLSLVLAYASVFAQVFQQKDEIQQKLDNYLAIYSITVYNSIKQGDGYQDTIQTDSFTDDAVIALGFDENDTEKTFTDKDGTLVCTMSRPTVTVIETDGIGLAAEYELTVPVYFGGSKAGEVTVPIRITSTFKRK
jgi:Na+-transporting NADH:ubiquinone oxidoreductase subunit NqrC